MNLRNHLRVKDRQIAIQKELGVDLSATGSSTLDTIDASARHCENMIGFTQVPVGIAGPLVIRFETQTYNQQPTTHNYFIPLATTEGALIASVSRGCKAIAASGGATVRTQRVGVSRGPVFSTANSGFGQWLVDHQTELADVAQQTSKHLRLLTLHSQNVGKYWYVRFSFDTQDAMGMNMVTIATQAIVAYITVKTQARCVALAGNYDIDKKASWLNSIEGRGIKAWASVDVSSDTLSSVLKTTASMIYEVWLAKCMVGSALSGALGYNCHFANVLAAIFLATGQDMAHVSECSMGITTLEITKQQGVVLSVYLPDLLVGTVGGGTGLATQKEALELLGVAGGNEGRNALRFAEIIAASVLAGEVSLLASLSEGSLAQAHQKLARGKE